MKTIIRIVINHATIPEDQAKKLAIVNKDSLVAAPFSSSSGGDIHAARALVCDLLQHQLTRDDVEVHHLAQWVAGWNVPGTRPDVVRKFDTLEEAQAFLDEELTIAMEDRLGDLTDSDDVGRVRIRTMYTDCAARINALTDAGWAPCGRYVWWIANEAED